MTIQTKANLLLGVVFILMVVLMLSGETKAEGIIKHNGFPSDSIVQSYVQYAWEVSNGDIDFITTLEAENGLRNPQRQSEVVSNGVREDSHGFCQLHRRRHSNVVDDPRFKTDPYRQLDQCWKKYSGGTRFYGYDVRHRVKNRFSFDGNYIPQQKLTVEQSVPSSTNTYVLARTTQDILDEQRERTKQALAREVKLEKEAREKWKLCKETGDCIY